MTKERTSRKRPVSRDVSVELARARARLARMEERCGILLWGVESSLAEFRIKDLKPGEKPFTTLLEQEIYARLLMVKKASEAIGEP